jgi:PTH1 family peptidyl-tRNA hydrolase
MKPHLVVIGLGNPGKSYEKTRHNVGFQTLDILGAEIGEGEWSDKQRVMSHVLEGRISAVPVLLAKPQTFMNRSVEAMRKIVDFYKLDAATQVIVISDDVDLPLGTVRFRLQGGPGTHNGLRPIVASFGEGFPRLRVGLGTPAPGTDLATWVLSVPPEDERKILEKSMQGIPALIRQYVLEHPRES